MTRVQALTWLKKATAADAEPALSLETDLPSLLDDVTRKDSGGTEFFDLDSLRIAAANGWEIKEGRASEYHGDGEEKIAEHCRQMKLSFRAPSGSFSVVKMKTEQSAADFLL